MKGRGAQVRVQPNSNYCGKMCGRGRLEGRWCSSVSAPEVMWQGVWKRKVGRKMVLKSECNQIQIMVAKYEEKEASLLATCAYHGSRGRRVFTWTESGLVGRPRKLRRWKATGGHPHTLPTGDFNTRPNVGRLVWFAHSPLFTKPVTAGLVLS